MLSTLNTLVIIPVLLGLFNFVIGTEIPVGAIREGSRLLHQNGKLERAFLKEANEVHGIQIKGWTWFDSTGTLHNSELAEDYPFGDIVLPEGSTVFFKDDVIDYVWLAHDMNINGLPVDGGGKIETSFYPDGQLRSCLLHDSIKLQGVMVRGGLFTPVKFDEDGNLSYCTLAGDYRRGGTTWFAGTEVWLDPNGKVIQSFRPNMFARWGRGLVDALW
jgi:hypothetical protein